MLSKIRGFMEGHPPDCACCRVVVARHGQKRARADADLSTFLPEDLPPPEEEEEGEEEEEEPEEEEALIHDALFKSFEAHVERLDAARLRRIETLSFKSALEDDGKEEINEDATQDEIEGLGVWQPGDEFQGDVNYRTLQRLLTRVDQRGFERSAQQLEARPSLFPFLPRVAHRRALCAQFHVAFMKVQTCSQPVRLRARTLLTSVARRPLQELYIEGLGRRNVLRS